MAGIQINALGRKARAGTEIFVVSPQLAASTIDGYALWTCPPGRRFAITQIVARWSNVGSTAAKAWIERVPSTPGAAVAPGSGTDTITTGGELDLTATANLNYFQGIKDTEGSTGANIVEPGETLMWETSGTLTNLVGFVATISLRELPPLKSA